MHQVEMISLEDLVSLDHSYRRFMKLWSFNFAQRYLKKLEKDNSYKGYGLLRLFKCLLLQFMEDLSDRELMRFLQENNSAKWFCGFGLIEETPHFTVFGKVRARKRCHLAAIKKNNMIGKNKDKDRWYSAMRSPYERVFSKQNKRVRYKGVMKNQFAAFMEAICFNLKCLGVLDPPNVTLA